MNEAPQTVEGKKHALKMLAKRRAHSKRVKHIDNASLPAGSPMYFYCKACGFLAAILPELYITRPPQLCKECQSLKDCGWLE